MEIIKVENLNFSYDETTPTIKDVSFRIEEGSYTAIVGHNGSGKSTIAKLLDGLLQKQSGVIEIGGLEMKEDNIYKIRSQIGIVFQNPDNQFIGATVADDIAFGLENQKVETEKMQSIIEHYAQKVNMLDFLDKEPTKLSGGQKQRVAIAGVLAMNLKVIILDEATSMLDPQGKAEINDLVKELHEQSNLTIVSITHDMEEILQSDQVIVLDNGSVALAGTPQEVLGNEDALVKLKLALPFVYKVQNKLAKTGITIDEQVDLEGVVEALCQLNSNT